MDIYMPDMKFSDPAVGRELAGSREIFQFLTEEISANTYLNIMEQYHPTYRADAHPALRRRVSRAEFEEAVAMAKEAGLRRLAR